MSKLLETSTWHIKIQQEHPVRFLAQSRWPIFHTYCWSILFSNLSSCMTQGTALLLFSYSNGLILQPHAIKLCKFSVLLPVNLMAKSLSVWRSPGSGFSNLRLQSKASTRFLLSLFTHRTLFKHIYDFWTGVFSWNLRDKCRGFIWW